MIGITGQVPLPDHARRVTGLFEGTADCEHVEILAGGTLKGKVISNNLTIDQNCTFEGESVKKAQAGTAKQIPIKKPELPANIKAS